MLKKKKSRASGRVDVKSVKNKKLMIFVIVALFLSAGAVIGYKSFASVYNSYFYDSTWINAGDHKILHGHLKCAGGGTAYANIYAYQYRNDADAMRKVKTWIPYKTNSKSEYSIPQYYKTSLTLKWGGSRYCNPTDRTWSNPY